MTGRDGRPWYERTLRWGQTNLTEIDPARYDAAFWEERWNVTALDGVIVNAGGIVAYYPSRLPLHRRAIGLDNPASTGDLYGEIAERARTAGLTLVARMDSNRASEAFYRHHPDWFACDADGEPYRAGAAYVACINGPYYRDFLPEVLREIIERSSPDGFADNSWAGLPRSAICHCENCACGFRNTVGLRLPTRTDWSSETYRRWIDWSYQLRTQLWQRNNEVTQAAGGPDCLWLGMVSGDVASNAARSIDIRSVVRSSPIIFVDNQRRSRDTGFEQNAETGLRLHALSGWDSVVTESTAMYGAGDPTFRVTSMPTAEVRAWASAGFAGGIQPWWHHIGAQHDDRRQYETATALFEWHHDHESALVDRRPIATAGVVWSQRNVDLYGQDDAAERVMRPYWGVIRSLNRARIPYLPVHVDDIDEQARDLAVLIVPALAVLSDDQAAALHRFTDRGGSLIVTGEAGRFDQDGMPRRVGALDDLLGIRSQASHLGGIGPAPGGLDTWDRHSYLRLPAESQGQARHPALHHLDGTDLIAFGGRLERIDVADAAAEVLATFVPAFPRYPPETSWIRQPSNDLPAIVTRLDGSGARIAYLAADLDRCAARDEQPDHLNLLADLIKWAITGRELVRVTGPGALMCHPYTQPGRIVIHLVNTAANSSTPGRADAFHPAGPLTVGVRCGTRRGADVRASLLVAGRDITWERRGEWIEVRVPSVADHEVIELAGVEVGTTDRLPAG